MKSINLYSYTRIPSSYATEYMNMLSARDQKIYVRAHEYESLKALVEELLRCQVPIEWMDGFFFSYSIRQISKEFDLLKIDPGKYVLNIELKSEPVQEEDIVKQLRQNRYYLGHVAGEIRSFTFIASTKEFYELKDDCCQKCRVHEIMKCLGNFEDYIREGIERIFAPRQFLISPLNTPDQFLQGQYFLTRQQQEIEEAILKNMTENEERTTVFGICGGAGTGKTLLLYDIVRKIAGQAYPCCIIHNGSLSDGHGYLKDHWAYVDIIPAGRLKERNLAWLKVYKYLFVDEADGTDPSVADRITKLAQAEGMTVIYSFDSDRWLMTETKNDDISAYLRKIEGYHEYTLSEKIRTSTEIITFFRSMLNLHEGIRSYTDYSDIDVIYANDEEETHKIIDLYQNHLRYKYIPNPCQTENSPSIREADSQDTHLIMEQGFDNILILMDDQFRYDEDGRIRGPVQSNSETLFYRLMYQDISRDRSRLCVLVAGNYELFLQISSIKYKMLERYQYRNNASELHLSGKRLSKLAKSVKSNMEELGEEDLLAASDSVDILMDELLVHDFNRKVVRNSIHLLRRIMRDNPTALSFINAASDFLDYLNEPDLKG